MSADTYLVVHAAAAGVVGAIVMAAVIAATNCGYAGGVSLVLWIVVAFGHFLRTERPGAA